MSKSGNYFYLVIDRASDGDETVHFMNLVDEADLLALMEDEQAEAYNAQQAELQAEIDRLKEEAEAQKEAEAVASAEKTEDDDFDLVAVAGKFLLAAVLVALAAGGICYVVLQEKKKRQAAKESIDPDADYREDEPEIELPLEEPEEDETDEAIRKAYQTSDGYDE